MRQVSARQLKGIVGGALATAALCAVALMSLSCTTAQPQRVGAPLPPLPAAASPTQVLQRYMDNLMRNRVADANALVASESVRPGGPMFWNGAAQTETTATNDATYWEGATVGHPSGAFSDPSMNTEFPDSRFVSIEVHVYSFWEASNVVAYLVRETPSSPWRIFEFANSDV
jgi:hypothetical protein